MKFKPLRDNILIKRLEREEKTAGGILLPEAAKKKPTRGQVIAVGEGRYFENGERKPISVEVDDIVLFNSWSGQEIEINGTEYLVMKEEDILGIIN